MNYWHDHVTFPADRVYFVSHARDTEMSAQQGYVAHCGYVVMVELVGVRVRMICLMFIGVPLNVKIV